MCTGNYRSRGNRDTITASFVAMKFANRLKIPGSNKAVRATESDITAVICGNYRVNLGNYQYLPILRARAVK